MSKDAWAIVGAVVVFVLGFCVGSWGSGKVVKDDCLNFGAFAKGSVVYSCTARS